MASLKQTERLAVGEGMPLAEALDGLRWMPRASAGDRRSSTTAARC